MILPASVPAGAAVLTVTQITTEIKGLLEGAFPPLWVVGEISSLTYARSGHLYFSLKDGGAVLPIAMWRTEVQRLKALPEEGAEVIVRGRLSVFMPRGNYQLIIDQLHTKGVGEQDLALRRLKDRLAKLGYFAAERKRPLPAFPRRIALVASPTGAAIRDMLETLRNRWPAAEVWVCSVLVQGIEAPLRIAAAFDRLNQHAGVDAVILGRGGGSSDDLSAFNDERVAHAIFRCKFPVVSAIGHEVDVTLADFVADHRALTPTDAANKVSPDGAKVLDDLRQRYRRLRDLVRRKLATGRDRLNDVAERRVFRLPVERLRERERALDDWSERLHRAIGTRLKLANRMVEKAAAQLESLSPLNVLARGYSLTQTLPRRDLVRSIDQVRTGDAIEIIVHDGRLTARVEDRRAKVDPPLAG